MKPHSVRCWCNKLEFQQCLTNIHGSQCVPSVHDRPSPSARKKCDWFDGECMLLKCQCLRGAVQLNSQRDRWRWWGNQIATSGSRRDFEHDQRIAREELQHHGPLTKKHLVGSNLYWFYVDLLNMNRHSSSSGFSVQEWFHIGKWLHECSPYFHKLRLINCLHESLHIHKVSFKTIFNSLLHVLEFPCLTIMTKPFWNMWWPLAWLGGLHCM